MAAALRRQGGQATTARRSPGGPVPIASVMAFLCLSLGGCGEVADEGTPAVGQLALFVWMATLGLALCVLCASQNQDHFRPQALVCSCALCLLCLVVFIIAMAPQWQQSMECDQSPSSPNCNGHGSMDCNRDILGSVDHPTCTCDVGWTGPTCSLAMTTTQTTTLTLTTRTRTSSTQTTWTMSTTTRTSSTLTGTTTTTTTHLCPGGSDPKLGIDIILDPSTDCPGVSFGMAAIPGAVIGAAVAGAPVLVVLCSSFRQIGMQQVIFDVIVAALDMGCDLFWVLTGDFYGLETLIPAVFFNVSPSLLFALWFFGHMTLRRPKYWARSLFQVVAAFAAKTVAVLARMWEMLKVHCQKSFSLYCGCFQYRTDIRGDLYVCCVNIAFWVGAVLLTALGLVTIFCSALFFLISGILLCSCLSLAWLIASGLWCATQTLVVMALHVTRLVALRPVNKRMLRMLDPTSPVSAATLAAPAAAAATGTGAPAGAATPWVIGAPADAATPASPATAAAAGPGSPAGAATPVAPTSDHATAWIDGKMWHAALLVEAILESLPCFAINILDMVLLIQVGLDSISVQAVLAASTSFIVMFRILFRYAYWLVYKQKRLADVPIEYQTKKDATGAAAGAIGSAIG